MPLYNYRCKNEECKHEFQRTQKMSDPNPDCPECKSVVEKVIKATTFILKGKGWFNTGGY